MARKYKPVDPAKLRTYSVQKRSHKASLGQQAGLPEAGATMQQWLGSLPNCLGAAAFRNIVRAIVRAVRNDRPVVAALGAHVIKVGCAPIIIDLMRRGIIRAIACNGAVAIHDFELATLGETSEEVADTIRDGSFGMVEETIAFFDDVWKCVSRNKIGIGEAVGRCITERKSKLQSNSILATAHELQIPACIHVALGTDTVHVSAGADGAAIGAGSLHDFRLLCDVVSDLGAAPNSDAGGVWLNIGSAVILPEVFLKAVAVARNLGANLDAMVTANFDMIRQYRPGANVVTRPVLSGRGFEVVGQHEILLPLLRQAVIEQLASEPQS